MTKILLITGDHPRHRYFARALEQVFPLTVIMQQREDMFPPPPACEDKYDVINWDRHFRERLEAETRHFPQEPLKSGILFTSKEGINSNDTRDFIAWNNPDIVITFGVTLLDAETLAVLPKRSINVHQGLSPHYRGVATLFWPFYNMQPNHAGTTIHYLDTGIDTGAVIHQCVPIIERGDGIHDVACKAVKKSAEDLIKLLQMDEWKSEKQTGGKLYQNKDFKPEHLRKVYERDLVADYLDGLIDSPAPVIFSQHEQVS